MHHLGCCLNLQIEYKHVSPWCNSKIKSLACFGAPPILQPFCVSVEVARTLQPVGASPYKHQRSLSDVWLKIWVFTVGAGINTFSVGFGFSSVAQLLGLQYMCYLAVPCKLHVRFASFLFFSLSCQLCQGCYSVVGTAFWVW